MATKTTKSVFDSLWIAFNALFSVNSSTEYVQMMVPSDWDGNINSPLYPVNTQWVWVYFVEPASFQTLTSLGTGANYTSSIESALSQPNLQIQARWVGSYTITVNQYRDLAGAKILQSNVFTRATGIQVNENMQITGNYVQIVYTNTSGAPMTETMLYASLGAMSLTPDTLGQTTSAKSIPIVPPSDFANTTLVTRSTPGIIANNTRAWMRANQFNEWVVSVAGVQQFALENTYGVAPVNPTIGTAIAIWTATATAYIGTAPSILIRNAATASGKDVYVSAIELSLIWAGTGLTDLWVEVHIDTANRYTSGGSAITGKTLYSQSATTAFTAFNASTAIVATADTATYTRLFRRRIRTVAPVAWDVYKLIFDGVYDTGSYAINGTVPSVYNINAPVCIIPPVWTLLIYIYATGMTVAPTWEGTIEFTER